MHPSIANLSSRLHLCVGEVPPPLVGASATLVETSDAVAGKRAHIYLFGGRLISSRRMVNTLYCLDLEHMKWSKLTPSTRSRGNNVNDPEQPQPRYFHSADVSNDKLIFFGGMGYTDRSSEPSSGSEPRPDDLCVLDEMLVLDLTQQVWDYSFNTASTPKSDPRRPVPRYAHLSSLSGDMLTIIGGQNIANQYVESINIFNLATQVWVGSHRFRKQCGSYRSLSVGAKHLSRPGERAKCYQRGHGRLNDPNSDVLDHSVSHSSKAVASPVEQNPLPTSVTPESGSQMPIYLYSNYNFTDVQRELEVLTVRSSADHDRHHTASNTLQDSDNDLEGRSAVSQTPVPLVVSDDRSKDMGGNFLPPGLRFPTGALLGQYLIISGTYLANATQTFSIWALHLTTMVWSRIEAGSALSSGSWNRAILWPSRNALIIVGHKERDLVNDYNHRQTNWDHVVMLDLEAWGVYQPPLSPLSDFAVQLGLEKVSVNADAASVQLNGNRAEDSVIGTRPTSLHSSAGSLGGRGDFEIICSDGTRIGCDRVILEHRWPWFKTSMDDFRKRARKTVRLAFPSISLNHFGIEMIPENMIDVLKIEEDEDETIDPLVTPPSDDMKHPKQILRDPRFQPRHLQMSEPAPVMMAFLQFIYTSKICTALQRHPSIVCALMVLAKTYEMDDLAAWACHAAHVALAEDLYPGPHAVAGSRLSTALSASSNRSSSPIGNTPDESDTGSLQIRFADSLGLHPEERHRLAVCLYETASLCGFESLQIRALRVVMAIARWLQKHGGQNSDLNGTGAPEAAGAAEGDPSSSRASTAPEGSSRQGSGFSQNSGPLPSNFDSTNRNVDTNSRGADMVQTPMISPLLTMSRSGSESASSQGPLTPSSSYFDHRIDLLGSTNASGTASSKFLPRRSHGGAKETLASETEQAVVAQDVVGNISAAPTTHGGRRPVLAHMPSSPGLDWTLRNFTLSPSASHDLAERSLTVSPFVPAEDLQRKRRGLIRTHSNAQQRKVDGSQVEMSRSSSVPGQPSVQTSTDRQSTAWSATDCRMFEKRLAKREKEEKKREAKEVKLREKAQKAERKRLAADAVFGPKESKSSTMSDAASYTSDNTSNSTRRGSELSDVCSLDRKSSLHSSHSQSKTHLKSGSTRGEWAAGMTAPWFSGPPPPLRQKNLPKVPT